MNEIICMTVITAVVMIIALTYWLLSKIVGSVTEFVISFIKWQIFRFKKDDFYVGNYKDNDED